MPSEAAERLAAATGRPVEAFESDAPLPALEELESVGEELRGDA